MHHQKMQQMQIMIGDVEVQVVILQHTDMKITVHGIGVHHMIGEMFIYHISL